MRVCGDGYKGSMVENGIYSTSGVLWGYLWRGVGMFNDGHGIGMVEFCLFGFGISTNVGYSMPYPFLYKSIVLFQTIQFSISTQSNC